MRSVIDASKGDWIALGSLTLSVGLKGRCRFAFMSCGLSPAMARDRFSGVFHAKGIQ